MEDTRDVRPIPLERCFKDTYQRPTDKNRASRIAGAFDPRRLKTVTVSAREGGRFAILDGSHRIESMRAEGYTSVWAVVLHGLTKPEEARLWLLLDGDDFHDGTLDDIKKTKSEIVKKSGYQTYKGRLDAEDVLAVEAQRILSRHGFVAAHGGCDVRNINSVSLVQSLCRRDHDVLDATFEDFAAMVLDAKISASALQAVFTIRARGVVKGRGKTVFVPDELIAKLRSYQVSRINSAAKPEKRPSSDSGTSSPGGGGYGAAEANSLLSLLNVGKTYHRRWNLAPTRGSR